MNEIVTVGCATSTGGKVISGSSTVLVNGNPIALLGDKATCKCGSSSCSGEGPIIKISPRKVSAANVNFARFGDLVDTGCGNCYIEKSQHQVSLGTVISTKIEVGGSLNIGSNVNLNNEALISLTQQFNKKYDYDEKVAFLNVLTGQVVAHCPYVIYINGIMEYSGRTDNDGRIPRIYTETEDDLNIIFGDSALAIIDGVKK